MRYFFEISYNGTNYNGWQSQPNATGIQAVVEDAINKLLREKIDIVASGRTDTGVHCVQQYFHADFAEPLPEHFLFRLNSFLPKDIAINRIRKVKEDANARYDAIERMYQYHIIREKDPFKYGFALFFHKSLDIQTMNEASALLVGKHDFECFSKVKTDVKNFICEIKVAEWSEMGKELVFTISANRFLRGMVRSVVGTLLDVGQGKITIDEFKNILKSRDRKEAGANVLPSGLYLVKVLYPDTIFEI
jgi:tRNA pseudouridine38-40 synthase